MGTHETQRKPEEVAAEAAEYMALVRQLLVGPHCDRRFVLSAQAHDENEYLSPAARAPEAH